MGTGLLGHLVIPPRHGQVDKYKIQAPVRNKKNQLHIFKGFEDQSDTYHDTRTHYLMEQDPSLPQDQAEVMDATVVDKSGGAERKKRWALQGHAQVDPALGTPCLGPVGLET
jgi:hypothetical protein